MKDFWQGLGNNARIGLVAGAIVILLLTVGMAWWLLRTDYQVLFSDLKPQDASAMTAELERMKVPYKIGENGSAIMVEQAVVHTTRIKLLGKDIPLHGAVGFELFNNTDFGMTEFAQKINYQRALQGELTRTILALAEIRDVRVHLAFPEQGLFKQASNKAKAAVTVSLRQGQRLLPEQVFGIQRLVAAAVPGMTAQDVTIVDNQGVALNRAASGDIEADVSSGRLDLKRETERYLSRKAADVLERTFGSGQVLASVDVTLNMDRVNTTTEDVIGVPGRGNQIPTGVIVRERESGRDGLLAPLDSKNAEASPGRGIASSQRETEYQVGRRVEQVVSQPGSIRRIQAVAVVPKALNDQQEERVRKAVAAAVGASFERGDTVVIQIAEAALIPSDKTVGMDMSLRKATNVDAELAFGIQQWALVFGLLFVVFGGALVLMRRSLFVSGTTSLSDSERQAALRQIQTWLRQTPEAIAHSGSQEGGK